MRVSYEKQMRAKAVNEKKWMVTISVDGKHLGDDSCCVQTLVDMPKAKELAELAIGLLRAGAASPDTGKEEGK